jgi:hypothetical protein
VKTLFAAGIRSTGSWGVAGQAFDLRVLSIERELRPLVVKRFPFDVFQSPVEWHSSQRRVNFFT